MKKALGPAAVAATVALSASLLACGGADNLDDPLGRLWEVAAEPETTIGSIPRNGEDEELSAAEPGGSGIRCWHSATPLRRAN